MYDLTLFQLYVKTVSSEQKALFVAAITNAESIRSCHVPDFSNPAQGPDPCQLASEPRYRKGPAACFDNNSHVSAFNQTWMMFSPFFKKIGCSVLVYHLQSAKTFCLAFQ